MLSKKDTEFIGAHADSIVAFPRNPDAIATAHSAERTNSRDDPFIGTCSLCGATGLTAMQVTRETCPNPNRVTEGDVFLAALDRVPEDDDEDGLKS